MSYSDARIEQAPDHLQVIQALADWWLGRTDQTPENDIFVLVSALNAAATEIEQSRHRRTQSLLPGQEKEPPHTPAEHFNQGVNTLAEAMLMRIDEHAELSAKQHREWRAFLRSELRANLEHYLRTVLGAP